MNTNNSFLQAIKILIKESINSAPYNRTKQAMIVSNNGDNTYDIRFDGKLYTNIISYPNTRSLPLKHIVKVIIPNNQASQMYISAEGSPLIYYPVGSYYETSDSTFNPNNEWGGTWELEAEGLVHIGAGSNYIIGATGGEETHTLTETEIPAHTHGKSGAITNGITGGSHNHQMYGWWSTGSGNDGYAYITTNNRERERKVTGDQTHTHNLPAHEHTSVGGSGAHNNMQPYTVVNRWHRTA